MIHYKAVRPDGGSFHDRSFRWLPDGWRDRDPLPTGGHLVTHPSPGRRIGRRSGADASEYLSVATVPTDCTGMSWPCILLAVEPIGRAILDDRYPHKRRVRAARVVEVLDPHLALGPQGREVAAIIDRCRTLTPGEWSRDAVWTAAWAAARVAALNAAWTAARVAARDAAWVAALNAAWTAARVAARDAMIATLARDLIAPEQHDLLIAAWREATR